MSNVRSLKDNEEHIPININISNEIKNKIKEYALSDLTRELGGVLLGYVENNENTNIVNITDYIIAKHTDAKLSSVTFTAETWAEINKEKDLKDPEIKIVGWFHTHPGFGIFLSNWDIFIQDNFFNLPWQIAYVVDPCHKTDGFFIWKEKEIIKINESSFDDINIEKNIINKDSNKLNLFNKNYKIFKNTNKYKKVITIINIILIITIITIIIYIFTNHIPIQKMLDYLKQLKHI